MRLRASCFLSFVLAAPVWAQYWEEPVSPFPLRTASPSKEWVLTIDSTNPHGRGAGRYLMERNGELAWEAEHPFTLYEVAIEDGGAAAGYAWAGGQSEDECVLAVIDASGAFRLREARKRAMQEVLELHVHPTWYPEPQGVLLDPANDRVIFRVQELDDQELGAHWYVHRLSDGARTGAAQPRTSVRTEYRSELGPTRGWRLLPDTGLVVVEWTCYTAEGLGVYFALIGPDMSEVWSLVLPRDHDALRMWDNADLRRMAAVSQILGVASNGAFSLLCVGSAERIDLRAVRDASAKTGWRIDEIGRGAVARDADSAVIESPAEPSDEPGGVELELLARLALGAKAGKGDSLRVRDFEIDDRGRAGWIRADESGSRRFALLDLATGQVIRDFALSAFDPAAGGVQPMVTFQGGPHAVFVGAERWVVIAAAGERATAWWLDASSGTQERIADFDTDLVKSAARTGDGGFAVLTGRFDGGTYRDGLMGFGSDGALRWQQSSISSNPRDEGEIFSPEEIALLPTGELAVLEKIANDVQFFSVAGKWLRSIDLATAWGRKPNYLSKIRADALGFVIDDFRGDPPVWRMTAEGKVLASFVPRHPDGRPVDYASMAVDPEGRVWLSDGDALQRLGEDGVVDRTHGAALVQEELGEIETAKVDHLGRVLLRDGRTKAIHGVDANGARVFFAAPLPEDFDRMDNSLEDAIEVASDGDVYLACEVKDETALLGSALQHLRFTAEGRRVGFEPKLGLDSVTENWFFQPNAERHWIVTSERLYLANGRSEPKTIERGPDGRWLKLSFPHLAAVAHDGSAALPATTLDAHGEEVECVHLYRADGEPRNTVLPGLPAYSVSNVLYTGDRLLFPEKEGMAWTVFGLDGAPLGRYALPVGKEELGYAEAFVAARGRELWVVSKENYELWRFALP